MARQPVLARSSLFLFFSHTTETVIVIVIEIEIEIEIEIATAIEAIDPTSETGVLVTTIGIGIVTIVMDVMIAVTPEATAEMVRWLVCSHQPLINVFSPHLYNPGYGGGGRGGGGFERGGGGGGFRGGRGGRGGGRGGGEIRTEGPGGARDVFAEAMCNISAGSCQSSSAFTNEDVPRSKTNQSTRSLGKCDLEVLET
ncbi:hypothetical protein PAPYR_10722 [Paratrimastix pyriformis]|uniref:Uncharacterized protein n=1 Tax=Paratrimastix pyriformis TaxID=342808 RepID=A0ABQ8U868_9EUKA|nr:hypothetical protein PAPYR_10722 [Paratrimastix pyriformis]